MSELQKKLEQYGFPEPDDYPDSATAIYLLQYGEIELHWTSAEMAELTIYARLDSGVTSSKLEMADFKMIRSDNQWQAVANFIRFLRGE